MIIVYADIILYVGALYELLKRATSDCENCGDMRCAWCDVLHVAKDLEECAFGGGVRFAIVFGADSE